MEETTFDHLGVDHKRASPYRYEMVFDDGENPQDQRASDRSRRQEKDTDLHHGSGHHSRMVRELERPRADNRDMNSRRIERESRDMNRRMDRDSERYRDTDRTGRDFDNKARTDRRTEREPEKYRDPPRRTERDMDRRKESRREYSPEPRVVRDGSRPESSPSRLRRDEENSRDIRWGRDSGRTYPDEAKEGKELDNRRRDSARREKRSDELEPRGGLGREKKAEAARDKYGEKRRSKRETSQDSAGDYFHKATGKDASRTSNERDDYGRRERSDGRHHKDDMRSKKRRS